MGILEIIQSEHQTITVSDLESNQFKSGDNIEVGTELIASITAEKGYTPGDLNEEVFVVDKPNTVIKVYATPATKEGNDANNIRQNEVKKEDLSSTVVADVKNKKNKTSCASAIVYHYGYRI